jgi:hypothetical protein
MTADYEKLFGTKARYAYNRSTDGPNIYSDYAANVKFLNMTEDELIHWLETDVKNATDYVRENQQLYDLYSSDPKAFVEQFTSIREKYQNKVEINNLVNSFTPDWDLVINQLSYSTDKSVLDSAEEAGVKNATAFYEAYLTGLKTKDLPTTKNEDGKDVIDYDAIRANAKTALAEITTIFKDNKDFSKYYEELMNIYANDYSSSEEY